LEHSLTSFLSGITWVVLHRTSCSVVPGMHSLLIVFGHAVAMLWKNAGEWSKYGRRGLPAPGQVDKGKHTVWWLCFGLALSCCAALAGSDTGRRRCGCSIRPAHVHRRANRSKSASSSPQTGNRQVPDFIGAAVLPWDARMQHGVWMREPRGP
jgi:hypothetical protein